MLVVHRLTVRRTAKVFGELIKAHRDINYHASYFEMENSFPHKHGYSSDTDLLVLKRYQCVSSESHCRSDSSYHLDCNHSNRGDFHFFIDKATRKLDQHLTLLSGVFKKWIIEPEVIVDRQDVYLERWPTVRVVYTLDGQVRSGVISDPITLRDFPEAKGHMIRGYAVLWEKWENMKSSANDFSSKCETFLRLIRKDLAHKIAIKEIPLKGFEFRRESSEDEFYLARNIAYTIYRYVRSRYQQPEAIAKLAIEAELRRFFPAILESLPDFPQLEIVPGVLKGMQHLIFKPEELILAVSKNEETLKDLRMIINELATTDPEIIANAKQIGFDSLGLLLDFSGFERELDRIVKSIEHGRGLKGKCDLCPSIWQF